MQEPDGIELTLEALRARRNRKWTRYSPDVLPAWIADMDFTVAPAIQEKVRRIHAEGDYGYPDRGGDLPERALARAFAKRQRSLYGWEPDPELALPVNDLVQAIYATAIAYSEPGEGVLLQLPAYPPFLAALADTGRRLIADHLVDTGTRWGVDISEQAVKASQARLVMLCNPQNPTGRVFERSELEALADLVVKYDLVLVSDEVHAEIVYPGSTHLPIATLGREIASRTVTITSATKTFNIAGLRSGVMHFGSASLRDRFKARVPDRLVGQQNVFGVDATLAAWQHGSPWLSRVMSRLEANRTWLRDFLAVRLPGIGYREPEATYFAWLDMGHFDLRPSPQEFMLREAKVAASAGSEFGDGYEQFVRLNFATSPPILEEIMDRIARSLESRLSG